MAVIKSILNSFLFWGGWIIIPFIIGNSSSVRKCVPAHKKRGEDTKKRKKEADSIS